METNRQRRMRGEVVMRGALGFLLSAVVAGWWVDQGRYGLATVFVLLALNYMMPAEKKP